MIESKNSEYLAFIVVYLVPFFGFTLDLQLFIALLVFFIFFGLIYVRTSLFCINPLLNLLWNYNIYEININNTKAFLLTKNEFTSGNQFENIKKITKEVYWGEFNGS